MLRRLRAYDGKRGGHAALLTVVLVSAGVLVLSLNVLVGGYVEHWAWTGYRGPHHKMRTLWDWLGVSILPLTVALTPVWLRTRGRRRRAWRVAAVVVASVLAVCTLGGYLWKWRWTGFTGNTLYDWLALFLVPCALPVTFMLLDSKPSDASVDQLGPSTHPVKTGAHGVGGRPVTLAMGAAVLLGVVTVAALLEGGLGGTGSTGTSASPRPSQVQVGSPSSIPQHIHRWVIVESQDPWWTDSGLHVTVGETVSVSAVGQVRARGNYHWARPSGLESRPPRSRSITRGINHAALVATVGSPGQVGRLKELPPSRIIGVVKEKSFPVTRSGELFLGLNDKRTRDNTGWFGAMVTVSQPR